MGACAGKPSPETKHGSGKKTEGGSVKKPEGPPDFGLGDTHENIKLLGRGGTGETYLMRDKRTGELQAVKLIRRPIPKVLMPNMFREMRIQAELGEGHVNVINAKEAILTRQYLALVLEFAAGGSMTSYVGERWKSAQTTGLFLSEDEARYFFKQFILAVEYCHGNCVAHRDLKLDNTLLDDHNPPRIKLCDFGFAKCWGEDSNMYTHIGTPAYMSPELISNNRNGWQAYDGRSVDVWAGGVLLIVMLLGTFPFDHKDHPDPNTSEAHLEVWLQQVSKTWTELPHIKDAVKKLTPECMDLLGKIFVIDAKKRITLPEIKEHPWYNEPLAPGLHEAEEELAKEQAENAAEMERLKFNQTLMKARDEELRLMVEAAATRPPSGDGGSDPPIQRINLRITEVVENPGMPERMSMVVPIEEEE